MSRLPRRPRPSRRDRHGRGLRGRLVPAGVPLARSRAEQFDDLVLDAVEDIERRWERELAGVEFAVEDVPWVEHTSPDDVVLDSDVLDDGSVRYFHWPEPLARFRRARIPRNYREEFTTPQVTGYQTFNDPVIVQNTALTYPVRIVSAPEIGAAYIVDAGGLGGVAGVRGQVMRVTISNSEIRGDENFRVR